MSAGVALVGSLGVFFLLEAFSAFGLVSIMDVGMLLIVDIRMFLHVLNWPFDVIPIWLVIEHLSLRSSCVSSQAEDDSSCCEAHQGYSNSNRHEDVRIVVCIRVRVIRVIRIHAADAGCSCDLLSAAGCRTGGKRDIEV